MAVAFKVVGGGLAPAKGWPGGGVAIYGTQQLRRRLLTLGTLGSGRVIAAGVRAAMPVIALGFKAAINASSVSGPYVTGGGENLKREARESVGWKFRKGGTDRMGKTTQPVAKAGFAVASKKQRATRIASAVKMRRKRIARGEQSAKGKGLSAQNIHWAVLGTVERHPKRDSFKNTGKMPAFFKGSGEKAIAIAGAAAMSLAVAAMKAALLKEAKAEFAKAFKF